MTVKLNREIQAVILAVQEYKLWRLYDMEVHGDPYGDGWHESTRDYYMTLPLPEGLQKNTACFEAVEMYPVDITLNTPMEDLGNFTIQW